MEADKNVQSQSEDSLKDFRPQTRLDQPGRVKLDSSEREFLRNVFRISGL